MTHLPKSLMKPEQWCLPAFIYAAIILAYIMAIIFKGKGDNKEKAYRIIVQLIVSVVVLVIMLMACEAGLEWIPWMMMLIPIIWIGGVSLGIKAGHEECKKAQ
jgi:small-conductance mechanosensitive channel